MSDLGTPAYVSRPLLAPDEPPPVEVVNGPGRAPLLLICDHASNAVPRGLRGLGLDAGVAGRHIAWDIGAAAVTRSLARRLDAPAVLAGYSRLVIDCNRPPGDPTSVPPTSDGVTVPGNRDLDQPAREARLETCFWPYHCTITRLLARMWDGDRAPALLAIHSFTPRLNGQDRPWHVGVLWNRDPRMAVPLMHRLRERDGLCIGDNEPYSGREIGYSMDTHAGSAGLPHAAVEIRQDLIADEAGAERWAGILAEPLARIVEDSGLLRIELF